MAAVVAFLSQKGGVGKSTLARTLAAVAADAGLSVMLADLDVQQRTLMRWGKAREQHRIKPVVNVAGFDHLQAVLSHLQDADLTVLDLPGQLSDDITAAAARIHLIVQPTSPSVDDLHPSLLVFQALQRMRIAREGLAFALCRVLCEREAQATRRYLGAHGYAVLRNAIPERLAYREALNFGRCLTETRQQSLNASARLMMLDLLDRAFALAMAKQAPQQRARRGADAGAAEPEPISGSAKKECSQAERGGAQGFGRRVEGRGG